MTDTYEKSPPATASAAVPAPTSAAAADLTPWWAGRSAEASHAADVERSMSIREALRLYPKAIFWSCVITLVIIMDGYDTALIGSFFGYPTFQQRFGVLTDPLKNSYQVEAKWQTALGLSNPLGGIVGIFLNGILTERFGHKKVLLGAITWLTGTIFIVFFAPNIQVLFAGELLCGLSWGVFTTMGPAYASEVAPVALRAYLEIFVVTCWGIGQLVSNGVLDGLNGKHGQWGWRIPVAVQWVWPVIIVPLVIFCPESPWWLVRKGRLAEAEHSFRRLSSVGPDEAKAAVALMVETTELERSLAEGESYADCFKGDHLWRTEITCVAWVCQVLVGFAIVNYATYFYEQAGLPVAAAYKMSVGQSSLHFVCNVLSVFVMTRFGRRTTFLYGAALMATCMFIIGFIALPKQTAGTGYASSALFLLWFAVYELTLGPATYVIVGETSSTKLRSKTIALARNAYNVFNIISLTVSPYVLNPTEGNWKGKTGFLAGGFCLLCFVWGYFRLPECKGRTYEELDILFNKRVGAKDFSTYIIEMDVVVDEKTAATTAVEHRE
ncbi:MFS transporter, SP family, general alpha glucoside:H+ symporter [Sporothrix brasiliensis 5110]|uniref:MFS transporter, SP family, general alpha glucoside:H+ symporter n=1 Tax=Sporothrix brasiliensis 5110 TaxID=1398154 RepID=A0A0C2IN17_9PEZI|nr:MFS transporter, SP family, general alpha glucoside:H+ symporter [Sporothrix brasiliensis 5110]KIH86387.1 MFS transporter, SP family, general alpha glucoside:H+ symporter [Sporothrix brasiliensis 5110]